VLRRGSFPVENAVKSYGACGDPAICIPHSFIGGPPNQER
jgi:hypothetical protein